MGKITFQVTIKHCCLPKNLCRSERSEEPLNADEYPLGCWLADRTWRHNISAKRVSRLVADQHDILGLKDYARAKYIHCPAWNMDLENSDYPTNLILQ
jgi:hypothetical protein